MRNVMIIAILMLAAGAAWGAGSAGNLDPTFDGDGLAVNDFGFDEFANAAAERADGKLVVVGQMRHVLSSDPTNAISDWGVACYDTDGSLDSDFGAGGWVSPIATDKIGVALAVAIDAIGRIVVSGYQQVEVTTTSGRGKKQTTTTTTEQRVAVARLEDDGSLDPTFGDAGVVLTEIPGAQWATANSLVILGNGDILVAGQGTFAQTSGGRGRKSSTTSTGAVLVCYDSDGELVAGFGAGGILVDDFSTGGDAVATHGLGVQSDGMIVIAGRSGYVRRYEADGTLDTTFATDGTFFPAQDDRYSGLTIDASDGILVGGARALSGGDRDGLVSRITADGSSDWTWLTGTSGDDVLGNITVDSADRIVAVGEVRGSTQGGYVVRLTASGSADAAFGLNGTSELAPSGTGWLVPVNHVLVAANDDIVLVGGLALEGEALDWFLARYCGS